MKTPEHEETIKDREYDVTCSSENVHVSTTVSCSSDNAINNPCHNEKEDHNSRELEKDSVDVVAVQKELGVVKVVDMSDEHSDTTCSDLSQDREDEGADTSYVFQQNVNVTISRNNDENVEKGGGIEVDVITEEISEPEKNPVISQNTSKPLVDYEINSSDISHDHNMTVEMVSATKVLDLSLKNEVPSVIQSEMQTTDQLLVGQKVIKQEANDVNEQEIVPKGISLGEKQSETNAKLLESYRTAKIEDTVHTLDDERKYNLN